MFGEHAGFIIAAYAVTVTVVTSLIVWVLADGRARRADLATLEDSGITRTHGQETGK